MAQEMEQERLMELKRLVNSQGWKTCLDLWAKLLIRKEKEKSDSLRVHDVNGAIRLQGYIDALNDCTRIVEREVRPKVEDEGQPYSDTVS